MKKAFFILLISAPFLVYTQEKGVRFEKKFSWEEIKQRSKAENKYIFLHCYTSYCGPSRYMTSFIYPTEEVGRFMNNKFISVKIQMDTTAADGIEVKSWYQAAHEMAAQYHITASPTYMIFDPDGQPVHRFAGQVQTATEFIEKTKKALDPDWQYFNLLKEYKSGRKDSAFLHRLAIETIAGYDRENILPIVNDWLNTQTDLYTTENLSMLGYVTNSSRDRGFQLMFNEPARVNSVMGRGYAEEKTFMIIAAEEISGKNSNLEPDWETLSRELKSKYPSRADEVITRSRLSFYQYNKNWGRFQHAFTDYLKKYKKMVSPEFINNNAWLVFENGDDRQCLAAAAKASWQIARDTGNPAYMDTYANLLYKQGKKNKALKWEQKAMESDPGNKKFYEETMEKMKRGERTWNS